MYRLLNGRQKADKGKLRFVVEAAKLHFCSQHHCHTSHAVSGSPKQQDPTCKCYALVAGKLQHATIWVCKPFLGDQAMDGWVIKSWHKQGARREHTWQAVVQRQEKSLRALAAFKGIYTYIQGHIPLEYMCICPLNICVYDTYIDVVEPGDVEDESSTHHHLRS